MITIHHVRETGVKADLHLYCGRKGGCWQTTDKGGQLIFADLGNPFQMPDESHRDQVCDAYENMLMDDVLHIHWKRIERIGIRLHEGKSAALYCFCAPKRCHCLSIKKHAEIKAAKLRDPMNPFIPNR